MSINSKPQIHVLQHHTILSFPIDHQLKLLHPIPHLPSQIQNYKPLSGEKEKNATQPIYSTQNKIVYVQARTDAILRYMILLNTGYWTMKI